MWVPMRYSISLISMRTGPGNRGARDRCTAPVGVLNSRGVTTLLVTPGGHRPAGSLLVVVAALALPEPIEHRRRTTPVVGGGMVVMTDRGIAIRRATGVVTNVDEPGQPLREQPRAGLHRHQRPTTGMGVEPPQRRPRPLVRHGPLDQTPPDRRGHRTVPADPRRHRSSHPAAPRRSTPRSPPPAPAPAPDARSPARPTRRPLGARPLAGTARGPARRRWCPRPA